MADISSAASAAGGKRQRKASAKARQTSGSGRQQSSAAKTPARALSSAKPQVTVQVKLLTDIDDIECAKLSTGEFDYVPAPSMGAWRLDSLAPTTIEAQFKKLTDANGLEVKSFSMLRWKESGRGTDFSQVSHSCFWSWPIEFCPDFRCAFSAPTKRTSSRQWQFRRCVTRSRSSCRRKGRTSKWCSSSCRS